MKTKTALMVLPFLCAAGGAMAQEGAQQEAAGAAEPAAAQAQTRVEERAQAKPRKAVRRQGADMRHCLDMKGNAAIIRCAEPGRKP